MKRQAEVYKKYPAVTQSPDLIRRLPAEGKLIAVMNVSGHPDMAKEMLKNSGLGELLDSLKSELPFDPALLTSSFGTQVMGAIIVMPEEQKIAEDEYYSDRERINKMFRGIHVIVAIPVKNKENFEKLYSSLAKTIADLKQKMNTEEPDSEDDERSKGYFFKEIFNSLKLSVKYNDSLCVLSLSDEMAERFINDPGNGPVPSWFQAASQYPLLMNFNFREFINILTARTKGMPGETDIEMQKKFDVFGDIRVTGGDFSNGSVNSHMEFTLGNKDQNALLQLFEFVNNMMGEKERYNREEDITDTAGIAFKVVTPVVAPVGGAPVFSDPDVQSYVNDYAILINDYLDAYKIKDMTKLIGLSARMEDFSKRSIPPNMAADPEEAKKFTDYVTKLSEELVVAANMAATKEEPKKKPAPAKSKTKPTKKN